MECPPTPLTLVVSPFVDVPPFPSSVPHRFKMFWPFDHVIPPMDVLRKCDKVRRIVVLNVVVHVVDLVPLGDGSEGVLIDSSMEESPVVGLKVAVALAPVVPDLLVLDVSSHDTSISPATSSCKGTHPRFSVHTGWSPVPTTVDPFSAVNRNTGRTPRSHVSITLR